MIAGEEAIRSVMDVMDVLAVTEVVEPYFFGCVALRPPRLPACEAQQSASRCCGPRKTVLAAIRDSASSVSCGGLLLHCNFGFLKVTHH